MSDQQFLRCNCESCGSAIEFPAEGVGLKIDCPHCGRQTLLSESVVALEAELPQASEVEIETSSAPSVSPLESTAIPEKRSLLPIGALVLVVLAAVGGVWYFTAGPGAKKSGPTVTQPAEPAAARKPEPVAAQKSQSPVATPVPTNSISNPPAGELAESNASIAEAPKSQKSIDDLKPSAVALEKAKAGNLTYAVGTLKNNSDLQRFGVRVELDLTDARGYPAGKASDYTQVIEPHQEWRFRALVLDPKGSEAVAGKVSSIKEDN